MEAIDITPLDIPSEPVAPGLELAPSSAYDRAGCAVNGVTPAELFQHYLDTGFLYPDKLRRLEPYREQILDNWERAAAAPSGLLKIVTFTGDGPRSWASLSTWRHTAEGWCTQHLVSRGDPSASRALMLAEHQACMDQLGHQSNQNWFRPDNRMPRRVFGSIVERLGTETAAVRTLTLFEVPLAHAVPLTRRRPLEVDPRSPERLARLAEATRGRVHVTAEGLAGPDFALTATDRLYQTVGLRRYRRAWLIEDASGPRAALVAYRGPLGLNFSYLENRADLLVAPDCTPEERVELTASLVATASAEYADFAPGFIPMVADEETAATLTRAGYVPIRAYCQGIWLRASYPEYMQHLHDVFAPVVRRAQRRLERASHTALRPGRAPELA